jgi:hypothetical protein
MSDERRSPLHPLAALSIIGLDGIFGTVEILDPLALIFTCVGVGALGFVSTTLVQRNLAKEDWGVAITKGVVMGILAGIPYPIAGTAVGVPLLIWAGANRFMKLPGSDSDNPPLLDDPENKS